MKALISSTEISDVTWISSWTFNEETQTYEPYYSGIENTMRVAEVAEVPFEVNPLLFWVDCPDDCQADQWYYKDGALYIKPEDVPQPV